MVKNPFKNIVNVCLPHFSGGWHTLAQARLEDKRRTRMKGDLWCNSLLALGVR
jgi:hypothetical protein